MKAISVSHVLDRLAVQITAADRARAL